MNRSLFTVLQVDDDRNDLLLMRPALELAKLPVNILCASDGAEAMDYLAGNGIHADRDRYPMPSLILLDLKMPRKNGFEVLQWIRCQPKLKRLPVAVFTSSIHGADIDRAYDCGANSYLIKPVTLDALVELVTGLVYYWGSLKQAADDYRVGRL